MKDLINYLLERVNEVNVNNPKANTGATVIKLYLNDCNEEPEDILKIMFESHVLQIINKLFRQQKSDSPVNAARLTITVTAIGKQIYTYMGITPSTWQHEVRLGDFFIEVLYNCGYIDITYPARRNSSHTIKPTFKWKTLFKHIVDSPNDCLVSTTLSKPEYCIPTLKRELVLTEINPDTAFVRSVNKLQQSSWRINEPVLRALQKANGFVSNKKEKDDNKELKRQSKIIEWGFIQRKAEALVGVEFYQQISVDYRGRIYYDEPFLNYQGSDLARGLFLFGESKPLKQENTFWLAVHTANCYNENYHIDSIPEWCEADYVSHLKEEKLESISVDKMTLEDRAKWTDKNMDKILELGESHEFDMDAEKPVAFLACCIEWFNYNNNIDNYLSYLPIAIDGSNNGWQHLGAMSKDEQTGKLVGLIPTDIQNDFYVQTAKELINQTDDNRLLSILKDMPMKDIRKGISKRGSMTRAYSAGASKIADNMWSDCKSEDYDEDYGITEDDCKGLSKNLIDAIQVVCPGPLQTMAYLQALAAFELGKTAIDKKLIERRKEMGYIKDMTEEELEELTAINEEINRQAETIVYGNGSDRLSWETPAGFPVEYTDWHMNTKRCRGTIAGYRQVNHVLLEASDKPNIQAFMRGIAPNWVHSYDSAHMMLVIDDWDKAFGAVHDSYSTHACDIEELLQITKENFVNIYDVDNFFDHIENQLISDKTNLDIKQPTRGNLNILDVYGSDYFFS